MGMILLFAFLLGGLGLATLFVVPWLGAAALAAAVIFVLVGLGFGAARVATDDPSEREPRDVEAPHMPGPSSD